MSKLKSDERFQAEIFNYYCIILKNTMYVINLLIRQIHSHLLKTGLW